MLRTMKDRSPVLALLLALVVHHAHPQTTLVLQPDAATGKDATLHGLVSEVNNNWGSIDQFPVAAWTFLGVPGVVRGVLDFDLSAIPSGATITSAHLSMYAYDQPAGFGQHADLSGSNAAWIQRVTSTWDENTVTWNTQPSFTTINEVAVPGTSNPLQDYLNMDVTLLVQDMIDDPANSFGFLFKLQDENYYRRLNFATSDHADPARRPRLVVSYLAGITPDSCVTYQPNIQEGKDALLHGLASEANVNYGSNAQLAGDAWTFLGTPGVIRSVFDFLGMSIPPGALLTSASLDLYAWDQTGGLGQHSTLSGSNEGWLRRVTSPWDQYTVTWNTAPSIDTVGQVALPASTSPTQNYLNIDVTALVQLMLDDPAGSHGFELRLQNENYYRLLNFCSSDHMNYALHPALTVCYDIPTSVAEAAPGALAIHPNPAGDFVILEPADATVRARPMTITDPQGRVVMAFSAAGTRTMIDVSGLAPGRYMVHATAGERPVYGSFVVLR